jgi:hypothetical protein
MLFEVLDSGVFFRPEFLKLLLFLVFSQLVKEINAIRDEF